MIQRIKRRLKKLAREIFKPAIEEIVAGQVNRSQEVQVLLSHHYKDLVRRNVRPLPTFDEVGFRCHSQSEEDGILLYIFSLNWNNKQSIGRDVRQQRNPMQHHKSYFKPWMARLLV